MQVDLFDLALLANRKCGNECRQEIRSYLLVGVLFGAVDDSLIQGASSLFSGFHCHFLGEWVPAPLFNLVIGSPLRMESQASTALSFPYLSRLGKAVVATACILSPT